MSMKAATAGSTTAKVRCGRVPVTLAARRLPSRTPRIAVPVKGPITAQSMPAVVPSRSGSTVPSAPARYRTSNGPSAVNSRRTPTGMAARPGVQGKPCPVGGIGPHAPVAVPPADAPHERLRRPPAASRLPLAHALTCASRRVLLLPCH